jgi:hypothetical protein
MPHQLDPVRDEHPGELPDLPLLSPMLMLFLQKVSTIGEFYPG